VNARERYVWMTMIYLRSFGGLGLREYEACAINTTMLESQTKLAMIMAWYKGKSCCTVVTMVETMRPKLISRSVQKDVTALGRERPIRITVSNRSDE
jgi:hypothetical protein